MKLHDLTLSVQSPLGTLLAADTLFGHICWGIRYSEGVAKLEEFLGSFEKSDPALLLSDPFPLDFWPIPVLPKPIPNEEDALIGLIIKQQRHELSQKLPECPLSKYQASTEVTNIEAFDILKWLNKLRWIETAALEKLANKMSTMAILEYFISNGCGDPKMPVEAMVAHNTINRLTNMTLSEGGLFFTKDQYVSPDNPVDFHLLVASNTYSSDEIVSLFENALSGGYGRDKSTGKGKIKVGQAKSFKMPSVKEPNTVLLLGPSAPAKEDPTDGYWQIFTRYGKLGGDWATGPGPTGNHNPFKRPLTMLKSGSVLFTDSPRLYYGRLIDNVHAEFAQVKHYGLSIAMPMRCDMKELK